MLYMSGNGIKIVVLETANLDELKKGHPAHAPDGSVLIAWTPDPVWLSQQIIDSDGSGGTIARLIDQAAKRPENPTPATHTTVKKEFKHG